MNPKLAMLGAFAVGIVGSSVATAGHFDGKIEYCHPTATGCEPRTVPDWIQVNQSASQVKRTPGAAGWKLCGALLAVAGFGASMSLARSLSCIESKHQKYQGIWDGLNLQKLKLQAQAELESFNQQVMIQAAEQSYAVLAPYQEPLQAEVVTEAIAPADKASPPAEAEKVEVKPDPYPWLRGYLSSTSLAWGNQGSGKSWFVRLLAKRKVEMGYRVIVFDPNSNATEWQGVELYNTYDTIEDKMRWYVKEVQQRYENFGKSTVSEEEWRAQLWKEEKAITVIAEEATTYSDFIEDKELVKQFIRCGATLSRKQEMPITFVAHDNTQTCLGDIKGLANLIGRMQQIQLIATTDPLTAQPVASGKALIRLDGSTEWMEVTTPKIDKKITVFKQVKKSSPPAQTTDEGTPNELWQRAIDRLNSTYQLDTVDTPVSNPDEDIESDSGDPDTLDTYPEGQGFPPQKQLLTMLADTDLPTGRFIKETLKATGGNKYRIAKKAIAFVLRRHGNLELMQKFKDCLEG